MIMAAFSFSASTGVNWPDLRRDYDSIVSVPEKLECLNRVNWPDLRRDYDSQKKHSSFTKTLLSELTWFEKGLRLFPWYFRFLLQCSEWIDLIWEGITTLLSPHVSDRLYLPEWIDLIWEGITTNQHSGIASTLDSEWIDLIWEGITTMFFSISYFMSTAWVNWPDLRRDYDSVTKKIKPLAASFWVNWPDLRRDYDQS